VSVTTEGLAGAHPIRPFHVDIAEDALDDLRRRITGHELAGEGDRRGSVAGRAAGNDSGTRTVLGDGVRLAQVGHGIRGKLVNAFRADLSLEAW